jgi:hypothetical protein
MHELRIEIGGNEIILGIIRRGCEAGNNDWWVKTNLTVKNRHFNYEIKEREIWTIQDLILLMKRLGNSLKGYSVPEKERVLDFSEPDIYFEFDYPGARLGIRIPDDEGVWHYSQLEVFLDKEHLEQIYEYVIDRTDPNQCGI